MKKCVIIPVFNEAEHIKSVIESVRSYTDADIIVIDDGSEDMTEKNARAAGAFVIRHPFNMGYGATLQTGYKYAVRQKYDVLLQMDGDTQHDPKYIPLFFKQMGSGGCDVLLGSRFMGEGNYKAGILKSLGIGLFRWVIWVINSQKITDPTSGYQCLRKEVFTLFTMDWFPCDYPDANIIIMLHCMGFEVKEIPVAMFPNPLKRSMHQGISRIMYYFFKVFLSIFITLLRGDSCYRGPCSCT